jgi:hypothetical protein
MGFYHVITVFGLIASGMAVKMDLYNKCPFDVWPGILPAVAANGGFHLPSGQTRSIDVPDGWKAGRIWARRGCDGNMNCDSGFCGNKVECSGAGGEPPVTLAEFTLNGHGGQDYYDVSLVDGYNLPIIIIPKDGTFNKIGGEYDCMPAGGCVEDLIRTAPDELKNRKNGQVVSVSSACHKFNTDQYCCRGEHNRPETCQSKNWPKNYPAIFKKACRTAYSYAYDDIKSTFVCRGSNGRQSPDYTVQFC